MAGRRDIEAGSAYVRVYMKQTALQRGIKDLQRKLKKVGAGFTQLGRTAMIAGGAMVGAITAAVAKFAGFGDQLDKMSARTGVSVTSLSELKFAAEQSGASLEDLGEVLQKMNRRFGRVTADAGSAVQVDAIESLGLSIEKLNQLDAEGRFLAIADAMSRYGDNAAAAGLAQRIFGTGVDKLLPLIFSGADGIRKLREEAKKLGLVMSEEDVQAAVDLTDALNRFKQAAGAAFVKIGAAVGPMLSDLSGSLTRIAVDAGKWIDRNREMIVWALKVSAVVVGFGGTLLAIGVVLNTTATAIGGLSIAMAFLAANPIVLLVAGLAAAAAALVYFTSRTAKFSDVMSTAIEKADQQRAADAALMRELQGLADKQSLTNDEMDRAETILGTLEKKYGDLGVTINRTTGEINDMAFAQAALARQMQLATLPDLESQEREAIANRMAILRERNYRGREIKESFGIKDDSLQRLIVATKALEDIRTRIAAVKGGDLDALLGDATSPGGASAFAGPITGGVPGATEQKWADRLRQIRINNMEDAHRKAIALIHDRYNIERREAEAAGDAIQLLERARMAELAAERSRFGKQEAAEKADQLADRERRRRDLGYQVVLASADANLPGAKEALARLDKRRALEAAGDDPVQQKMALALLDLEGRAGGARGLGREAGPRGTFSGAALAAMGGGGDGGPAKRTADGIKTLNGLISRLLGLSADQITAIKKSTVKFT